MQLVWGKEGERLVVEWEDGCTYIFENGELELTGSENDPES